MTSAADGFSSRLVRGFVELAGLIAALAGVITWAAGWQHGHSLTTLGLAGVIIGGFNWKVNRRRRLAAVYARHLELAMRKSDTRGALTAASFAVHYWRKLAAKRPIENQWLAPLLDQQWDLLHESGRHDEALPVAREAVETWRQLQADEPGYTERLARSVNRVAVTLGRLDREEEAIPFTTEAISIRRRLVALGDQALGLNLSNLAISLIDGEQWERALPAAEEALEIQACSGGCRTAGLGQPGRGADAEDPLPPGTARTICCEKPRHGSTTNAGSPLTIQTVCPNSPRQSGCSAAP